MKKEDEIEYTKAYYFIDEDNYEYVSEDEPINSNNQVKFTSDFVWIPKGTIKKLFDREITLFEVISINVITNKIKSFRMESC